MQCFETVLLSPEQQLQLAHWIAEADPHGSHTFELLFRASNDGFCAAAFHDRCDRQGPTVVVARKTDGYLFGGYTDMSWDCNSQWKQCKHAFLFSISGANKRKYPIVWGRFKKTGIFCGAEHGATFGREAAWSEHDMNLFHCCATTAARFCPRVGFCDGDNSDKLSVSCQVDQVEAFAVRACAKHDARAGSLPEAPPVSHASSLQPGHASLLEASPICSEAPQCSHSGMPDHARFCMHCGQPLRRSQARSRSPDMRGKFRDDGGLDLEIVGFKLFPEEECSDHHGDELLWDRFRARLLDFHSESCKNWDVKEEIEETGEVVTVPIGAVFNLQQRCSSRFRDGRTLEQTIRQLKNGQVNELKHPNFVLNVAKACLNGHALYWTLDHRRFLCMKLAGKQHVRVRIVLAGRAFDDFARKARERHHRDPAVAGEFQTLPNALPVTSTDEGPRRAATWSFCLWPENPEREGVLVTVWSNVVNLVQTDGLGKKFNQCFDHDKGQRHSDPYRFTSDTSSLSASITISKKMSELDERVKAVEKPEEEMYWRPNRQFRTSRLKGDAKAEGTQGTRCDMSWEAYTDILTKSVPLISHKKAQILTRECWRSGDADPSGIGVVTVCIVPKVAAEEYGNELGRNGAGTE
ncbi:MTOR-associated protein MEAK7 (MEAK7) (TBC/LysM-associated domain-containing protein 1) (TLD domain-containing protein 1) [Durusdinium trenchii]|uniref:MTOR-associated protein MEAK7 (MEAK7) (TBC/LysM-associated domain-containing protein 1) (TLD domain-containing protein 1) n=1 Tax=Durusdinium trenchii TaxID=1381693 RepID=A0ABP0J2T8_9DINO